MKSKILSVGTAAGLWTVLLTGSGLAAVQSTLGPLPNSCGTWIKQRNPRSQSTQAYETWVLGFLSGAAVFGNSDVNILNGVDVNAVHAWIDNYCKANPLDELPIAASKLMQELYGRAKQKP